MLIIVRDLNKALIDECEKAMQKMPDGITMAFECQPIFTAPATAIVSPANSFGFMDGGIDFAYTQFFGAQLQERVQNVIKGTVFGELLVGSAFAISTYNAFIPNLIVAPTMRVPKVISDPNDVFLATRAAIHVAAERGFECIILPGMGTGVGRVRFDIAARCMADGITQAIAPRAYPEDWLAAAYEQHHRVTCGPYI